MHLMAAQAMLGHHDLVARGADFFASNRDYTGRSAAAHALSLARRGRVEEALAELDGLADSDFFDTQVWRAKGYLVLLESGKLPAERRTAVLDQAWTASHVIPGYARQHAQLDVVEAMQRGGADREEILERLASLTDTITSAKLPGHILVPILAKAAVRWGVLGDAEKVAELVKMAEPRMAEELQEIERPTELATFGEAYIHANKPAAARPLFERAVAEAAELVNPRPRALSCVDIALSFARCKYGERDVLAELARILDSFHGES
jgi:hypothetical protein